MCSQWLFYIVNNRDAFFTAKRTIIYYGYEGRAADDAVPSMISGHFAVVRTDRAPMPVAPSITSTTQLELATVRDAIIREISAADSYTARDPKRKDMYGVKRVMAAGFKEKVLTRVGELAGDGILVMQDACGVFWSNFAVPFAARSYVHVGRAWRDLQPINELVPQDFLASSDEVAQAADPRNVWGEVLPLGQFRADDIVCTDVSASLRATPLGLNFDADRRSASVRAMESAFKLIETCRSAH